MSEQREKPVQAPFVRYERWRHETVDVATVTPENVGQIAALIGGSVDYAKGEPVLVAPGDREWRVECGWNVSMLGTRLLNQNGFNVEGDWTPVSPSSPVPGTPGEREERDRG